MDLITHTSIAERHGEIVDGDRLLCFVAPRHRDMLAGATRHPSAHTRNDADTRLPLTGRWSGVKAHLNTGARAPPPFRGCRLDRAGPTEPPTQVSDEVRGVVPGWGVTPGPASGEWAAIEAQRFASPQKPKRR